MMRLIFGDKKAQALGSVLNRFNNPDNDITRAFEDVGDAVKEEWKFVV